MSTSVENGRVLGCPVIYKSGCLGCIGVALQLYAGDPDDAIVLKLDGMNIRLSETWMEGWLRIPGPDSTNTIYLKQRLLRPCLGDPNLWRCPSNRDPTVAAITMPRVRTVSLSCFMCLPVESPAATTYQKLGDIIKPSPAEAMMFIDERVTTINDDSFGMQWDFDPANPRGWILRDKRGIERMGMGRTWYLRTGTCKTSSGRGREDESEPTYVGCYGGM